MFTRRLCFNRYPKVLEVPLIEIKDMIYMYMSTQSLIFFNIFHSSVSIFVSYLTVYNYRLFDGEDLSDDIFFKCFKHFILKETPNSIIRKENIVKDQNDAIDISSDSETLRVLSSEKQPKRRRLKRNLKTLYKLLQNEANNNPVMDFEWFEKINIELTLKTNFNLKQYFLDASSEREFITLQLSNLNDEVFKVFFLKLVDLYAPQP